MGTHNRSIENSPLKLGKGELCPKCSRRPMERRQHSLDWKPKPYQPYWFAFWDVCGRCRHTQHYEYAKVFVEVDDGVGPVGISVTPTIHHRPQRAARTQKTRFADLDPTDPFDQLPGVDSDDPPW